MIRKGIFESSENRVQEIKRSTRLDEKAKGVSESSQFTYKQYEEET